ncbi:hypothetical protein GCM10009416_35330 [Craurococcus roseus]|uniref:Uncharacterized protein n=1 Tax=Craurococcus roseus TaxID=77585 RepID=A0ABN1FMG3_9PROT
MAGLRARAQHLRAVTLTSRRRRAVRSDPRPGPRGRPGDRGRLGRPVPASYQPLRVVVPFTPGSKKAAGRRCGSGVRGRLPDCQGERSDPVFVRPAPPGDVPAKCLEG